MENIKIDIGGMTENLKFCKEEFGDFQLNRQYVFYEGYIHCLLDYKIIDYNQFMEYKNMLYKSYSFIKNTQE